MSIKLSDGSRAAVELEDKETIARIIESTRKAEEEMKQREEAKEQPESKTLPELPKEDPKVEVPKGNKLMNIITSKRIAAFISLLLCVFLYFALLTTAFSTKVNTYICYTQSKDDQFHDITCWQLKDSSVEETTVYHASDSHVRCSYCKPSDKITITERNYVIPLLISAPISVAVFLLLTYRKKEK